MVKNGYEVLTEDLRRDHKELARQEVADRQTARLLAIALGAPVVVLAMADITLPWSYLGRNAQRLDSGDPEQRRHSRPRLSISIAAWWRQARNVAANMDTLISLGTLAALLYSLWGMWRGSTIFILKPAP